jgi:hypothetical protein
MHVSAGELVPKPTGEPTPNPVLDPLHVMNRCAAVVNHFVMTLVEPCMSLSPSPAATSLDQGVPPP